MGCMNTPRIMFTRRRFMGLGAAAAAHGMMPFRASAEEMGFDKVSVIHTTDLHGNVLPTSTYDGVGNVGGLARCATRIKQWRSINPHSMLVDIGDLYQGTQAGYATRGNLMTRCLNHLDFDAWVLGNHEFDWGMDAVHQAVADSRMPVLAGNSIFDGKEVWNPDHRDDAAILPYIVKELNGYRVAFIGLTTPNMANWFQPEMIRGFEAVDPVPVLRKTINELKATHRPHALILGTHMGIRPWSTEDDAANRLFGLTEACPEIDAIIGGHTHRDMPNSRVNDVLYTQANYFGIHLGRLDLVFDRNTRKLAFLQPMTSYMDGSIAVDPEVVALVRDDLEEAEAFMGEVVGSFAEPFGIRNSPGNASDLERLIGASIYEGLNRREIPVDAVLHGLLFQDSETPAGEKTVRDIWSIVPFENYLVTAEVTHEQLRIILREMFANVRQLRSLMGLKAVISGRGESLSIDDILTRDGGPLPDRRIHIALNSYDASSGGGRFPLLREILMEPESNRQLHFLQSRALLIEYVQRHTPVRIDDLPV
jgi:2',3'-cyclic-nucleotide 2'-phosphodiesterase (5'-nucleotidase family)